LWAQAGIPFGLEVVEHSSPRFAAERQRFMALSVSDIAESHHRVRHRDCRIVTELARGDNDGWVNSDPFGK
jgi:hypothetical protein